MLVHTTRTSRELYVASTTSTRNAGKNLILPLRLVHMSNKLNVAPTCNAGEDWIRAEGEDLVRDPILLPHANPPTSS